VFRACDCPSWQPTPNRLHLYVDARLGHVLFPQAALQVCHPSPTFLWSSDAASLSLSRLLSLQGSAIPASDCRKGVTGGVTSEEAEVLLLSPLVSLPALCGWGGRVRERREDWM
jgi:hypothetical protein